MGAVLCKGDSPKSQRMSESETKLEAQVIEAVQRRALQGSSIKSFNSFILKFPKIDENLRKCKAIFDKFDEDKSGAIDHQELRHCFNKLELTFTEEEIDNLFEACDLNKDMGMTFNEFVVLLCLVYLLEDDPTALQAKSCMGMPDLEATFDTLAEAFVLLDKNKDGYVSKNEMVVAVNNAASGELSSGMIAIKIFDEMDWDHNGMVNFKEFLFAFTRWVGIDESDEGEEENTDDKVKN